MYIKYFIITICLFAFTCFRAQNDGTTVNVRLFPVQMLAITSPDKDSYTINDNQESRFVTISSPSGFEIKMQHNNSHAAEFEQVDYRSSSNEDKAYSLIKYKKGVIEKIFEINDHLKETEKNKATLPDEDYYVLTMMSN